jgi:hypothetical protein
MHTFLNANELKATAKPTSHDNSSTITILYTGICIAHLVLFTLFIVLVVYIFKTDEIYACAQLIGIFVIIFVLVSQVLYGSIPLFLIRWFTRWIKDPNLSMRPDESEKAHDTVFNYALAFTFLAMLTAVFGSLSVSYCNKELQANSPIILLITTAYLHTAANCAWAIACTAFLECTPLHTEIWTVPY